MKRLSLFSKDRRTSLESEMDRVVDYLNDLDPSSKEYQTIVKNYEILTRNAKSDNRSCGNWKISPETKLTIGVGVLLTLFTLFKSEFDIVDSKVWKFIPGIRGR